jgi:hypothetical protein
MYFAAFSIRERQTASEDRIRWARRQGQIRRNHAHLIRKLWLGTAKFRRAVF